MSDRFERFTTQLNLAQNDWRIMVGNPYIAAYTHAYETYKDTLGKQKEAGELFVTAACVATGSVLLASVGSATMKMIAKRTVVRIANSSLLKNFSKLFRIARKNEGVAFAVGNFIDGAKGELKKKAEEIATKATQSLSSAVTPEPLVQFLNMDSMMRANVNCSIRMAQMIEEQSWLDEAGKNAAYGLLKAAPIYVSPTARPSKYAASLSELIELTFYLSAVLETDSLVSWPAMSGMSGDAGMTAQARDATSVSITPRPGAADYPRPAAVRPDALGNTPASQSIAVDRAGGEVQKRTNELCQKAFNKPLYSTTMFGLLGPADTKKTAELQQADSFLDQLAATMKPENPFESIH